jgi:hypothetical protein
MSAENIASLRDLGIPKLYGGGLFPKLRPMRSPHEIANFRLS